MVLTKGRQCLPHVLRFAGGQFLIPVPAMEGGQVGRCESGLNFMRELPW